MANNVRIQNNFPKVAKKVQNGSIQSLARAGAYLRGIAMRSIKKSQKSAPAGHQPHTRRGQLRRAIWFDVDKRAGNVVIGPRASWIKTIGSTHEFGKTEYDVKRSIANNWKIKEGGHGPIEGLLDTLFDKRKRPRFYWLRFAKLKTAAQVMRAKRVVESFREGSAGMEVDNDGKVYLAVRGPRKYPEREFMGPALDIGKARIPWFWKRSIVD